MNIDWKEYFDNLAMNEVEEYKQVGWVSNKSMYSKFYVALSLLPLDCEERLLDIGCGTGAFEELLSGKYSALEIHAIDVSVKELSFARQRNLSVNFRIGSITNIPYPDSFFNCVTCFGVLQNFNGSLLSAITEMSRVLKERGDIFITTLDADFIGFNSSKRKSNSIFRYFVPEELKKLLGSAGVSVTRMGAIYSEKLEGLIVPLHHWYRFFIQGKKRKW